MIEGVLINKLKQIPDDRGAIYHMLRRDSAHFIEFGEIYFSIAFPGIIKKDGTSILNKYRITLLLMVKSNWFYMIIDQIQKHIKQSTKYIMGEVKLFLSNNTNGHNNCL